MHVLCAPDSFKGSISGARAAEAIEQGVREAMPEATCDRCPVADGGEGTLEVLVSALGGSLHHRDVTGPWGTTLEPVRARFGFVESRRLGIIELAEASGLSRLGAMEPDPTRTTSFGTGQLLQAALDLGAEEIIIGIGGSATVDGGTGLVQALGGRFFDCNGIPIKTPLTGGQLNRIAHFEPPDIRPRIRVACDVTNPLTGPDGAATIYGPQKGASSEQVVLLDAALSHLASLTETNPSRPGAGAAGGAGFGLVAFCGATLEPGIDLVLETLDFESRCAVADLVLTGEGKLDSQSLSGKACLGVAKIAHARQKPCYALVGQADESASVCCDPAQGGWLTGFTSLNDSYGLQCARSDPAACLAKAAGELIRSFR